jgi:hypothetical protein
MRMRKWTSWVAGVVAVLLLCAGLVVAGCGKQSSPSPGAATTPQAGSVQATFRCAGCGKTMQAPAGQPPSC